MIKRLTQRFYYGWIMLAVGFTVVTITYGARFCFGTLFNSLLDEFGWTRAMVTSIFSVSLLCQAVFQPFAGAFLDKYGAKKILCLGAVLIGISFIIFGNANSYLTILIAYGVLFSLAIIAMGLVVNTTMISHWFSRKRGIATAIIVVGTSLGIFIFNPLLAYLISNYGWRMSVNILGCTAGLLILTIVSLLAYDKPQDVGQNIDGLPEQEIAAQKEVDSDNSDTRRKTKDFSFNEALKTRDFWFFVIIYIGDLFSWFSFANHSIIAMTDSGVQPVTASTIFGYVGLLATISGLFFSWLSDLLSERRIILSMGFLLTAIGIMVFARASSNLFYLYTAIIVIGLGNGAVALMSATVADRFGTKAMGKIWGTITTAGLLGGAVGPVITGYLYDTFGSYSLAWQTAAAAAFIAASCVLLLDKKYFTRNYKKSFQ
jgi:MFS family permease